MAGGPALRIEAMASKARAARLDPADAMLKGPLRLGKGLLESSLALPLLVQIAQQLLHSSLLVCSSALNILLAVANILDHRHRLCLCKNKNNALPLKQRECIEAALTAKREPISASTLHRTFPAIGNLSNSEVVEAEPNEDSEAPMAIDSVAQEEVGVFPQKDDDLELTVKFRFHGYQSKALFEDEKDRSRQRS
jgi:hypothetical protein